MLLSAGDRIGRYVIEAFVGSGGMADVYRAVSPTRGVVAIKVPKMEDLTTREQTAMLERFAKEAFALARLRHRGIVEISEVSTDLPRPFLVMEYLDGLGPFEWGRLVDASLADWLRVGAEVCEALAYAHDRNMLHRDLKASNILILTKQRPPAETLHGQVKLIDWGLVRDGAAQRLTEPGLTPGTLGAIDPAVLRDAAPFSPQSDLYSFGAFLYRTIVGQSHLVPEELTIEQIRTNQDNEIRQPQSLHACVPDEVDTLLVSLLASNPRERPKSAAEVAVLLRRLAAVHEVRDNEPIHRRPTRQGRASGGCEMRSALVALGECQLAIALHTTMTPTGHEWDEFLDILAVARSRVNGHLANVRALVLTDGGGPSTAQRALLNAFADGNTTRVAVISESLLVRGIVTAVSWANNEIKNFSPEQLDDALKYLGVAGHKATVVNEIRALHGQLAHVRSARQMLGGD